MQLSNAIKKLDKANFEITQNGKRYSAKANRHIIDFIEQDGSVLCVKVRSENDMDDSLSDYSAGVWCDNLTQAIKLAH
jgi:hypothetical protein